MFYTYDIIFKLRQKKQRSEKVKTDRRVVYISLGAIFFAVIMIITFNTVKFSKGNKQIVTKQNYTTETSIPKETKVTKQVTAKEEPKKTVEVAQAKVEPKQEEVQSTEKKYDNMTVDELGEKLDRSLTSTLAGTGKIFARKAIELGVDPYMSVAIVLHETGCTWNCSRLVRECNNVGGMKGAPGCGGGSYKYFSTLEEGINGFMDNLYYNYVALGLTTPEQINPKYAASTTWATKVNAYIDQIKAR